MIYPMKTLFLLFIIIPLVTISGYAQERKLDKANQQYNQLAFIDATEVYLDVANSGYKSEELFEKLGNSYYFNANYEGAAKWYRKLFAFLPSVEEPTYYLRYSQSLKAIGKDKESQEWFDKYAKKAGLSNKKYKNAEDYLALIEENSGRFEIKSLSINTPGIDFGTAFWEDKIVFASTKDTATLFKRRSAWDGLSFLDLYQAKRNPDGSLTDPTKLKGDVNTKLHESTPVFTKDGKTMYFTRNNYLEGKKGKNENNVTLIKIYKAILENDQWTKITELPFDSDNYSTAHPALSPDEKTLYFASDMPGTLGQSDLFKVQINEDGTFGKPVNLGKTINTEGRETFPFVNDENEIYFASDGHPGLGGLDIFVSKINEDGTFATVQNVGSDVNSPKDDFAYWIDTKSRKGFFTSNRDGGQGFDDIYKFLETRKLKCEQVLYGKITELATNEAIPEAKISLFDSHFTPMGEVMSDSNGDYTFAVECGKTYNVRAEKTEYTTKEEKITVDNANGKTNLNIALEKEKCKVAVGDDLGKCFGIKMIYFDLDKSNIRKEAALDLEKILDVLSQNPTMKLDIRSHTDSRATFKYNEDLSDRRAKSTINWLIKNGVSPDRLTGKGYGEYQLVNQCTDGVNCTEEQHQMNRRSEFIITAL